LCANSSTFADLFPNIENYIGDIGFGLSGGGELIRLFDSSGVLVDAVEYDDDYPWPEEPDGNGPSLALINPSLDNAQPESWAASAGYGSPGSLNSFNLSNEDEVLSATEFILHNNYPNPFNPTTTISFILPNESFVSIFIIDMLGRMVKVLANGERMNGYQKVIWDGTNDKGLVVAAGVYLYKIQAGEFVQTKKMVLLK
ncbi:MAG: T9SS type A sorting domain-containing protein, partial [Candidatus Marinimicrobia bacterium]|nr:T9SS type A sorting domain-containing protein [Candidatus Neomarinimicrobiota bacterium]